MASPKRKPRRKTATDAKAVRTTCPICEKPVESRDLPGDTLFPFCSRRCKLVDLQKWFAGEYSLSREVREDELEEE